MVMKEHIGKQGAALNIGIGCTPGVRIVLKDGVNVPPDFAARIKAQIVALVDRELDPIAEEFEWSTDYQIRVSCEQHTIQSFKDFMGSLKPLREALRKADDDRLAAMDADPNNGTYGMWAVDGVRHSTVTDATTAREAMEKAIRDGEVGDWESPDVTFLRPLAAPAPRPAPTNQEP